MLLCGNVPFSSELQTRMAPLRFYEDVWHVISADAKDVIKRLLCKDPVARLTAAQVWTALACWVITASAAT